MIFNIFKKLYNCSHESFPQFQFSLKDGVLWQSPVCEGCRGRLPYKQGVRMRVSPQFQFSLEDGVLWQSPVKGAGGDCPANKGYGGADVRVGRRFSEGGMEQVGGFFFLS